ncbi:MAG: D-glycero-beta-D-manno-heptose 1-phosphate adenylyltransferase [Candidatus Hydrogenedentota bacterium]
MDTERLRAIVSRFGEVRVMEVGDIYLDELVEGRVTEISLEAPIPVFEVARRKHNPGAAGNAACNAASLGAQVFMVGVIGEDANAGTVRHEFEVRGVDTSYIVTDGQRLTSTYGKLRAGGHNIPTQEVLRMDTPKPEPLAGDLEQRLCERIRAAAPQVDAIMVGDQVSATVSDGVLATIHEMAQAHGLFLLADSRNRAGRYGGFDVIVPNDAEAARAAGIEIVDTQSLHAAGRQLAADVGTVMITLGPAGIEVFTQAGEVANVPAGPCNVIDVTGAGDTVAAAVCLAMVAGASPLEAAQIANVAAGIAVGREGAATVARSEVENVLAGGAEGPEKLKTLDELKRIVTEAKAEGQAVVWTNGCFDILHVGHISYLMRAKEEGDLLVVGLNSDRSVQENKGPNRPVINEYDRATVLSAMECVDYLVIFDGKTPEPLLDALHPDVYAKGGDYTLDTIVQSERRLVEGYGGRIAIIPGVDGSSTTNIIRKLTQDQDAG